MSDVSIDRVAPCENKSFVAWFVFLTLLLALTLAVTFSREVFADLEQLRSADSDNVQWTLSQIEVEHLIFLRTLERQAFADRPDLEEVREKYDILYGRLNMVQLSKPFHGFASVAAFRSTFDEILQFRDDALPLIDGPDDVLQSELKAMWRAAEAIRPTVRNLSTAGLGYFAELSDAQRAEVAQTLTHLAIATASLLLLLSALTVHFLRIYRQTNRRGLALLQANQRMQTILSTSLDGVFVADAQGKILDMNAVAEQMFQRSGAQVKGRRVSEVIAPKDQRQALRDGLSRIGGTRRIVGKGRIKLDAIRADGEVFPIELAVQSAFDGPTEILIAFMRDISQRVADEKELVRARDQALAGEKAKAEFLAVMSHEIRTPLNGLIGNLSLLSGSHLSKEQRQFVRNMDVSGKILLQHVDSVLDIAKFEAGKLRIADERINLSELLQSIVDGQGCNASNRGNVIEWNWVGKPQHWVITDAQKLHQILLNLVGNAIKFTEFGRISIEAEMDCLPDPDDPNRKIIEFRVCDTGIGIAEEHIARVFEDFHTTDSSFGRAAGGTGLGLGIARRLAEAMGGEIGVESTLDEGSTFWVRLPLQASKPPERTPDAPCPSVKSRHLDILVVEDNEINLQVAQSMLEREGHKVTIAKNGRSGVEAAQSKQFDLILMDISMPVLDGLEATRLIRSGDGPCATAPIIALSASVLQRDKERFLNAGMDSFLGKPLTLDALRRALNSVADTSAPPAPPPQPKDLIDTTQIDELRLNLGNAAFGKLLDRFLAEADQLIDDLAGFDPQCDPMNTLVGRCHKVAGSAAVFGALDIRQALNQAERAADDGDADFLASLLGDLAAIWARTRAALDLYARV